MLREHLAEFTDAETDALIRRHSMAEADRKIADTLQAKSEKAPRTG